LTLLVGSFVFTTGDATAQGIKRSDVEGEPSVYLKVIKEPDPALMGGWKIEWRRHRERGSRIDINPVQYWLVKRGDRYALYFYRIKREVGKRFIGWQEWTANGNEIVSGTGIRFLARDGNVYFQWKDDQPVQMSRIEG
jgi:hypothetical protein